MNRFDTYAFYNSNLHSSLSSGQLVMSEKNSKGINLVVFRCFNSTKNNNIELVYSNLYYPSVFVDSLVIYLLTKVEYKKSVLYRECGDFFTLIDDKLINKRLYDNIEDIQSLNEYLHDFNGSSEWHSFQTNYISLFEYVRKTCLIRNVDNMSSLLSLIATKQYNTFFTTLSPTLQDNSTLNQLDEPKDYYLLKHCLFLVEDLESFLSILSKNFVINKGPKNLRNNSNSLNHFLITLDQDYRDKLYNHHMSRISSGHLPVISRLARSKFTFNNIHLNLGNVKHYSTTSRLLSNKQQLFDDNYFRVDAILKQNGYVGSIKIQEKIERMLFNQEKIFSEMNNDKLKFNFNDKSYNFINEKYKDLCSLLNYPNDIYKKSNSRIVSAKYIPLTKIIIKELGIEKTADIILSYFMYMLSNENVTKEIEGSTSISTPGIPTITAYDDFGKEIFNKYLYSLYLKSDLLKTNGSLKDFKDEHKRNPKNEFIYNDDGNYHAYIGGNILSSLFTINLIVEVLDKDVMNIKERSRYLRINDTIRNIFIKNNVKIYKLPQKLPMICEPKEYIQHENKKLSLGGYLLNDVAYVDELIKPKVGHEVTSTLSEENDIIDLVNGISKIPYKININTLNYIYKYGYDKQVIIDDRDEEIQSFLNNPYKRMPKKIQTKYRSIISKIVMERNILSIAEVYSKVKKIYFPVRLDFRSRVYCNTEYFDYQKSDLAKGLLLFSNPGVIKKTDNEIISYFKAYGANMYGNGLDKKSLSTRVKWIDENSSRLLDFETNDIVTTSENKVCFISFCFEYKRFIKFIEDINTVLFYTYLPIQLDATCNGYQHLALLTKEVKLLSKLNLSKSTVNEDPNDFYKFILTMTNTYIDNEIQRLSSSSLDSKVFADSKRYFDRLKLIKDLDLGRSIIKQVIMKESYSAGVKNLTKDILAHPDFEIVDSEVDFKDIKYMYKNSLEVTYNDVFTFVLTLKHVIRSVAPKISKLTNYLNGIVGICTKLKMPIPWVTISGLEIKQSYLIEKERKIAAFTFTKSKYTFKTYLKGAYDIKHQKRAIRPNFIHSLDGTAIALLYKNLKNVSIFTVHDCFAVTADHVPLLLNEIKLVYIHIYSSNNYMLTFDQHLRDCIKKVYKEVVWKDLDNNFIYIANGDKYRKTIFPNVMEVIQINDTKDFEDSIKQSIYPII